MDLGIFRQTILMLAMTCWCTPTFALDQVRFAADQVDITGGLHLRGVGIVMSLATDQQLSVHLAAASASVPTLSRTVTDIDVRCDLLAMTGPLWSCLKATAHARDPALGLLQSPFSIQYRADDASLAFDLLALPLAGGTTALSLQVNGLKWELRKLEGQMKLEALPPILRAAGLTFKGVDYKGAAKFSGTAHGESTRIDAADLDIELRELNLHNEAGTLVAEKLGTTLGLRLHRAGPSLAGSFEVRATVGQALLSQIFMDLGAHPLLVHGSIVADLHHAQLQDVILKSDGLLAGNAKAVLDLTDGLGIESLDADVAALEFPAAYTSLMQLALAATNFGNLDSSGVATGHVAIRNNQLQSLDLTADNLAFGDASRRLGLRGLAGVFHWRATAADAADSDLKWRDYQAYGVAGGAGEIRLRAFGNSLALQQATRVPVLDGSLLIQRFEAGGLGTANVSLGFDGSIESVGMPRLSRAFGWPEMSGTLSGRIPGLSLAAGTLSLSGDLVADVFDGHITASNLQLRDAFGTFPKLTGNFTARALDLRQITHTFPIGTITGRIDADVRGLELFGWSPIAFDANLYSSAGDKTAHRISQKAVGNLANIGGGGAAGALQSGFLRFFDDFGYDRIELRCVLRNDVCLMGGMARDGGGYYLVRGSGLPRLDVVGNSSRVAWSQLVSQLMAAIETGDIQVR